MVFRHAPFPNYPTLEVRIFGNLISWNYVCVFLGLIRVTWWLQSQEMSRTMVFRTLTFPLVQKIRNMKTSRFSESWNLTTSVKNICTELRAFPLLQLSLNMDPPELLRPQIWFFLVSSIGVLWPGSGDWGQAGVFPLQPYGFAARAPASQKSKTDMEPV